MILISWSIAYDTIMTYQGNFSDHILADKLPQLSMWFGISTLEKFDGWAGHNIAYAIWELGAKDKAILFGAVGKDFVEQSNKKINYSQLAHIDYLNTATGFIFTDKNNNQITPFYPGAMGLTHTHDILPILEQHNFSYAIISPNDVQAMVWHMVACKSKNIISIFDPGQSIHFLSNKQLYDAWKIADMLIMNEYERSLWKQKTNLDEHNSDTSAESIIVTLWEKWVSYRTRESNIRTTIEPIPCESVIDPTGAWDALRGGLLYGLESGKTLQESLEIGQQVARHCIQSTWAQNYTLHR